MTWHPHTGPTVWRKGEADLMLDGKILASVRRGVGWYWFAWKAGELVKSEGGFETAGEAMKAAEEAVGEKE